MTPSPSSLTDIFGSPDEPSLDAIFGISPVVEASLPGSVEIVGEDDSLDWIDVDGVGGESVFTPPHDVEFDFALVGAGESEPVEEEVDDFDNSDIDDDVEDDEPGETEIAGLPNDVEFDLALLGASDDAFVTPPRVEHVDVETIDDDDDIEGDVFAIPADVAFDLAMHVHTLEHAHEGVGDVPVEGETPPPSDAFDNFLAERAAASRPIVRENEPVREERDWQIDFGPVSAPAGFTTVITATPQVLFSGEKVMATDTAVPPGTGTRIVSVAVGQKIQRPAGGNGSLTQFFAETALGNGIKFDTAHPWANIRVAVSFIQACTFDMSVFGRAVL